MLTADHPNLTDQERTAIPALRSEVEAILAGPGTEVVDRLIAYVLASIRANVKLGMEQSYRAGYDRADARHGEALRKARANGALDLVEVATEIATVFREADPAAAGEQVTRTLAELLDLQRTTDRAIVMAELDRRQRVASMYPDLEQAATASATLLSFVASLIDAGMVPEDVAEMVATHQAARQAQREGAVVAAAGERAGLGKAKPSRTSLRQAKEQALAFLREAQKLEGPGDTLPFGTPKVEVLPGGVVGATEAGHREPRTYSPEAAVQLGLALLSAGYQAQAAAAKKGRR